MQGAGRGRGWEARKSGLPVREQESYPLSRKKATDGGHNTWHSGGSTLGRAPPPAAINGACVGRAPWHGKHGVLCSRTQPVAAPQHTPKTPHADCKQLPPLKRSRLTLSLKPLSGPCDRAAHTSPTAGVAQQPSYHLFCSGCVFKKPAHGPRMGPTSCGEPSNRHGAAAIPHTPSPPHRAGAAAQGLVFYAAPDRPHVCVHAGPMPASLMGFHERVLAAQKQQGAHSGASPLLSPGPPSPQCTHARHALRQACAVRQVNAGRYRRPQGPCTQHCSSLSTCHCPHTGGQACPVNRSRVDKLPQSAFDVRTPIAGHGPSAATSLQGTPGLCLPCRSHGSPAAPALMALQQPQPQPSSTRASSESCQLYGLCKQTTDSLPGTPPPLAVVGLHGPTPGVDSVQPSSARKQPGAVRRLVLTPAAQILAAPTSSSKCRSISATAAGAAAPQYYLPYPAEGADLIT
jgi:hypothetical protein